jgi:YD repeat-containing protein
MKNLICFALSLVSFSSFGQYYYTDVIGTRQTNQQYKLLAAHQLKRVSATAFDANNEPSKDFVLEQQVSKNGQQIITRSATIGTGQSIFTSTYNANKIAATHDSSLNAINTVEYSYDEQGRLTSTVATSKDFDGTFSSVETHTWTYNQDGQPAKMLKVKNGVDTTHISFSYDEAGNVSEESWRKNNRIIETYFYYYNTKKQLTDIVRYNRKAKQHLPDYMFEYDQAGRIIQMTQAQATTANYLVYRYSYNDRGLKEKEQVYNKRKEFLGKVEYSYN